MKGEILHIVFFILILCVEAVAQEKSPVQLDSAKVISDRKRENRGNLTLYSLNQIKGTVTALGEPDIIRHISTLPGISQGLEGTLGLFVRGANNGGNRIELNGVPLASYSHMLGLVSSICPDTVSETGFYPGGISAEHGNVSSSLIDISTKRASLSKPFTSLSVSPYLLSVSNSSRSKNQQFGCLVSGRASALPFLAGKALSLYGKITSNDAADVDGFIYDLMVQGDWQIKNRHFIDVMVYGSQDKYGITYVDSGMGLGWWLASVKAGWKYEISPKLTLHSSLYHVRTDCRQNLKYINAKGQTLKELAMSNSQNETNISSHLRCSVGYGLVLDGGLEAAYFNYNPARCFISDINDVFTGGERMPSGLFAGFLSLSYERPKQLELYLGLRETVSRAYGSTRSSLDYRAKCDYHLTDYLGIEACFDKLSQFHHVLEGLPVGWSLDISIPCYDAFPEEKTYQTYVGTFFKWQFPNCSLNACLGAYYRNMKNLVSYISSANFFSTTNASWDQELTVGSGRTYGGELSASFNSKWVDATVAYTISRSLRHYDEINEGRSFLFRYDRPHILNLNSDVLLGTSRSRKGKPKSVSHRLNLTFAYSSGNLVSVPLSSYAGGELPMWYNRVDPGVHMSLLASRLSIARFEYGDINNYRVRDYIRLDFSYSIEIMRRKWSNSWTFSVFNVMNRHNPMLVFADGKTYKTLSLLPVMPSVRWNCSF